MTDLSQKNCVARQKHESKSQISVHRFGDHFESLLMTTDRATKSLICIIRSFLHFLWLRHHSLKIRKKSNVTQQFEHNYKDRLLRTNPPMHQ